MAGHDTGKFGCASGNRPGVKHGNRPERIGSVKSKLVSPVRIHFEEQSAGHMGNIRVFPTHIQNTAVRHKRRTPVVFLVEGQTPNGTVSVQPVSIRYAGCSGNTGHGDIAGG